MYSRALWLSVLFAGAASVITPFALSQAPDGRSLAGPDAHDSPQGLNGHLSGDWGGVRSTLKERGVDFDFEYISDTLLNAKGTQNERVASWNRGRGTVDIDLGALAHRPGLYFHATALWQGGGNLGTYLGTLTSPSGMSSYNLFRLDSGGLRSNGGMIGSPCGLVNSQDRTSTAISITAHPSSSSRWDMRLAI
jgi:hypothetical protein